MGGLLGGILWLVNIIGGGVLYILVGMAAWRDTSKARWIRVLLGGWVLGLVVGLISFYIWYSYREDYYPARWTQEVFTNCVTLVPISFVIVSLVLEKIRRIISRKNE
jgi:TRAP-type uncharacterized transport system fused permease subunit